MLLGKEHVHHPSIDNIDMKRKLSKDTSTVLYLHQRRWEGAASVLGTNQLSSIQNRKS